MENNGRIVLIEIHYKEFLQLFNLRLNLKPLTYRNLSLIIENCLNCGDLGIMSYLKLTAIKLYWMGTEI